MFIRGKDRSSKVEPVESRGWTSDAELHFELICPASTCFATSTSNHHLPEQTRQNIILIISEISQSPDFYHDTCSISITPHLRSFPLLIIFLVAASILMISSSWRSSQLTHLFFKQQGKGISHHFIIDCSQCVEHDNILHRSRGSRDISPQPSSQSRTLASRISITHKCIESSHLFL